ncbi:DUF192 domain-containing protein [Shimia haliotis]|uniref:DUF192 domain-containing protein n=1 Tax=Shimia haliotis TaxID=1280847 RepID=A0A1I4AQ09_9RHOB|nr:DUF192 domain-containing protein [Shimia haliotis]SFK58618.1 hypothetical protein SAMN04488036_101526 [Shimia haliotis]
MSALWGASVAASLGAATSVWAGCAPGALEVRGNWGQARFTVEVADTDEERARGLMHRESMPMSAGMLFIYERPERASFWMRNTLIPLDILFADHTGVVRHIHPEAVPLDETPIPGGDGIKYVLEINGGLAEAMGISVGSELRHGEMQQESAKWRCE